MSRVGARASGATRSSPRCVDSRTARPRRASVCPRSTRLENRHVEIAVAEIFGWAGDGPRARIAPSRTVDGFTAACERILEVAAARGRIAFATDAPGVAPAALPSARGARRRGRRRRARRRRDRRGRVVGPTRALDRQGRGAHRWRPPSSATTVSTPPTNGCSPSPVPTSSSATAPTPGWPSPPGSRQSHSPTSTRIALAVAAWQGRSLRIVPLDDHRPPRAYAGLLDLLESLAAAPRDPFGQPTVPASTGT